MIFRLFKTKNTSLYFTLFILNCVLILNIGIGYKNQYKSFSNSILNNSYLNKRDEKIIQDKSDLELKRNIIIYNNDSLKEYRLIHEKIMNGTLPLKVSVNGHTYAGYANRLYSLLSSLVIALVTDSAFIVRWTKIDDHIKEPFFKTFYNFTDQQNEFNIDFNPSNVVHPKDIMGWQRKRNMDSLIKTSLPLNKTRFLYRDIEAYFFELCSNPEFYEKFYNYGLVSQETMLKAREIIFSINNKSSNYTSEIKQDVILQVPFEIGGNLLNKIWIPKDHIMNKVNHYVNTVFKNYYMIGIQLRYQYIKDPLDTYKFLNCSFGIEENLTKTIPNFELKYKGVKWFVTSDSTNVIERLKNEFPNKIITGEGQVGHIESNSNSYPRTILDVELLSRCDELILTGGSTFGNFFVLF